MGHRPSIGRTDSSPSRSHRPGFSDFHESHSHDRRDSRNRDRDVHQNRDRSLSPYSRRDSGRYGDRVDKYDQSTERLPHRWNNYRPEYSKDRSSEDLRKTTRTHHSRSESPLHTPENFRTSEVSRSSLHSDDLKKKDPMPSIRREGPSRRASSGMLPSDGSPSGSSTNPSHVANVSSDRDANPQILGPVLTGTQTNHSPKVTPKQDLVPGITARPLVSLNIEQTIPSGGEAPDEALGIVSKDLAEQAARLSTLRAKLQRAEQTLSKRVSEFEKSKTHHEKYPDIKESHGSNIKEAEKLVVSFKAQVKSQEDILDKLASRTAKQSLPAIIAQAQHGGSLNQATFDQVVKTCADFKELLESQQKLISELQRDKIVSIKTHQDSKDRLEAELKALKEHVYTSIPKEQLKLQSSIDEVKRGAAGLEAQVGVLSLNSTERSADILTLSSRTGDMGKLRAELKRLTDESPDIIRHVSDLSSKHDSLSNKVTDLEYLKDSSTAMENRRQILQHALGEIEARVQSVETRPEVSSLEDRFQAIERSTHRPTSNFVTSQELDALIDRIKRAEDSLSLKAIPEQPRAQIEVDPSILVRIGELERRVGSPANGIQDFSLNERMHRLSESVEIVTALAAGKAGEKTQAMKESSILPPELSDMQRRLSNLEHAKVDRAASARISSEVEAEVSRLLVVEKGLANVRDEIEMLKAVQDALQDCIGTTVSEGIEMANADSDTKLEALRSQLGTFVSDLDYFKEANDTLDGHLAAALTPTYGIESENAKKLQQFSSAFNNQVHKPHQGLERVNRELSSLTHGLNGLTSRVDNINTKGMAQFMLGQVAEVFPNLHDTEATIQGIRSAISDLGERVRIGLATQQSQDTQVHENKAMREQILNLTERIVKLDGIVKQAEDTAASVTSSVAELRKELLDQLEIDRKMIANAIDGSDERLDQITQQVDGHDKQIEALKLVPRAIVPQASVKSAPAGSQVRPQVRPPQENDNPTINSRVGSSGPSVRTGNLVPNRQTSVASSFNNSRKPKRKHHGSSASNSFKNSKSKSPDRKKARYKPVPDSEDDPEYDPEDDIPQPQMGSDGEE